MDPNTDSDTLWNQMIDECFEDNPVEEVIRLIREGQQVENNTMRRQKRRVINLSREGHSQLFNDYFSTNMVYTRSILPKVQNAKACVSSNC